MALRIISGDEILVADAFSDATIDFHSRALHTDTIGYIKTLLRIVHAMNFIDSDKSFSWLLQIFRSYSSSSSKGICNPWTAVTRAIDTNKIKQACILVWHDDVDVCDVVTKLHDLHGRSARNASNCTTGMLRALALSHFVPFSSSLYITAVVRLETLSVTFPPIELILSVKDLSLKPVKT